MLKTEECYIDSINKNYAEKYQDQFKRILALQKYTNIKKLINLHYNMEHDFLRLKWRKEKNIFLYGSGYWASTYSKYASINSLNFLGYVISDDQEINVEDNNENPIYKLKDLPYTPAECSFVLALVRRYFSTVRKNLMNKGYERIL